MAVHRFLRFGIAVFLVASVAAAVAPTIEWLMVARMLQGVGGAATTVTARAIARDIASGAALAQLTSLFATVLAIATLFAPITGAIFTFALGWRWVFGVTTCVGILAAVCSIRFIAETLPQGSIRSGVLRQALASSQSALRRRRFCLDRYWLGPRFLRTWVLSPASPRYSSTPINSNLCERARCSAAESYSIWLPQE